MNRRQKPIPPRIKNPAYRPAFARLDAALAKSLRSQAEDIGDIHRRRLAIFGCLPENLELPK